MNLRNRGNAALRLRWALYAFALVAVTALVTTRVVSDDKPAKEGPKLSAEEQKMMDDMMKLAAPGEHHKRLESMVGDWNVTSKFWMDPSAPPGEGTGTATVKALLGGRFFLETFEGLSGGQPLSGRGITGYDNFKKKFNNFWIDTMGTGFMISYGSADPSGKVITYASEYDDPMTKTAKKTRSVVRLTSESKRIFEMYNTTPDGKEFKSLEVVYTRK